MRGAWDCPSAQACSLYAVTTPARPYSLRQVALPVFGPSLMFGLGEGAIWPILPLTARELGASVPQAALVVTLIGLGSVCSNLPASVLTQRHGERWAMVAAAVLAVLAMVAGGLTGQLWVLGVGAVALGVAQSVFNLARQSYVTEAVPISHRARAMSTLGGMLRVGYFVGPFLGAAAIHWLHPAAAWGVGALAMLGAAAVAAGVPDLPSPNAQVARHAGTVAPSAFSATAAAAAPAGWGAVLRQHRQVFLTLGVGVMLIAAVRASRQVVVPLWADHLGLAPSLTAVIVGLAAGLEMLVFYPAGLVMDRKGRRWVAVPSLLIMALGLLLLPLAAGAWGLALSAMAIGLGNGLGSGLIMVLGADHSPRTDRARFLGLWRQISDFGSWGGPGLLSLLTAAASLQAAVLASGVIALAAAWQLAHWIPRMQPSEMRRPSQIN